MQKTGFSLLSEAITAAEHLTLLRAEHGYDLSVDDFGIRHDCIAAYITKHLEVVKSAKVEVSEIIAASLVAVLIFGKRNNMQAEDLEKLILALQEGGII